VSAMLELRVRDLIEATASESPTPGGGATAGLTAALAAGLTTMAARQSHQWDGAGAAIAQANALRDRLMALAPANDEAYEAALASLHFTDQLETGARNELLGETLARAAALPLAIADAATSVAELAAHVAEEGDASFRPDAVAATLLAEGAARASASLVEVNLAVLDADERITHAQRLVAEAAAASSRALAAHS
jgi:formiminotetrahydrofolate cyclodeaminase